MPVGAGDPHGFTLYTNCGRPCSAACFEAGIYSTVYLYCTMLHLPVTSLVLQKRNAVSEPSSERRHTTMEVDENRAPSRDLRMASYRLRIYKYSSSLLRLFEHFQLA